MSLHSVQFKCNFCGTLSVAGGTMWTRARFTARNNTTDNTLFDLEWTSEPMDNVHGSHICPQCASDLVSALNPPQANKPVPPPELPVEKEIPPPPDVEMEDIDGPVVHQR